MRRTITFLLIFVAFIVMKAQDLKDMPKDKTAILMVHFGTTFDDTRAATIDAINTMVKDTFPGVKVTEAYTSRIIIKRLSKRGMHKSTPTEALLRLAADGYTHVVVQPTNIICGIEVETLRKEASLMTPFFSDIRVGNPLLYSVDDCENVVKILSARYAKYIGKNNAVVLIGHGTSTPATSIYSQMDYMFTSGGAPSFHVATVEGYPTYMTTLQRLKNGRVKNVTLIPFMFVAGDHARNDIDGEWKEMLGKDGFNVSSVIEGLGEIPEIQNIYIDHIRQAIETPVTDISAQKASYLKENL
ncbi:sirohydrochlorin cobaltochelatase [Lepagella muris]|jgi:sirohydrochlorin cobaltochelatase|uniref:Sirohydrochlorin cobaltochelatase n=1 Tax=Lepagella muris TaxID=3032870 RepID=A0AC61REV1_9BACT|nr:sirohydrochlorin cobaltochelatase [Lepagella muris]ROT10064.1 sirohydrochlorin cobaltochelatase [Muribaculaceae bacterium Isolate-037 (Harlan)]TGY78269.1 sirohydrochlorin cobaltochelatase [Lepagella muris]THG53785.1 sirohydrochlorin cobaltochelatase [Bacteroidales bacterium]TKC66011.1 sirohydrochlorin cobaltochelatase [Bacteroidales bacterium]